ncbi:MAG: alpha/beta hydrolase domain-containing protein [Pseudomonadota bacterium]
MVWLARCAHAAEPALVATPRAIVLPVSATNRPFLAAARTEQAVALEAAGYSESEFQVSGLADISDWSAAGNAPVVRTADVPYTTRMLLRRPNDPRKFSGLVIVELLDASTLYDRAPLWGLSSQQFLRHGDAWVGITVRPSALAALRRFDPVRYGALGFAYNQAADCRSSDLRRNPADAESGLAWDMIAQVGALLRSSSKENPLLDLNPHSLVAAGYAQAGADVTTYANTMHALLRRGDGAPIYDGYLSAASALFTAPINQCAPPLTATDARRGVLPRDVPFVAVSTETDFNQLPVLRRADSDAPEDLFRLYEIAAGAVAGSWPTGTPSAADLRIAGFTPPTDACSEPRSTLPQGLVFNAIWQQYADFLASGHALPNLPRIETLDDGGARRDEAGNTSGGWRLPQLEVPLARYARGTPRDGNDAAAACSLGSTQQPFDAARLKSLYHTRVEYLRRFRAAVDAAVKEHRLVAADGEALKVAQASTAPQF